MRLSDKIKGSVAPVDLQVAAAPSDALTAFDAIAPAKAVYVQGEPGFVYAMFNDSHGRAVEFPAPIELAEQIGKAALGGDLEEIKRGILETSEGMPDDFARMLVSGFANFSVEHMLKEWPKAPDVDDARAEDLAGLGLGAEPPQGEASTSASAAESDFPRRKREGRAVGLDNRTSLSQEERVLSDMAATGQGPLAMLEFLNESRPDLTLPARAGLAAPYLGRRGATPREAAASDVPRTFDWTLHDIGEFEVDEELTQKLDTLSKRPTGEQLAARLQTAFPDESPDRRQWAATFISLWNRGARPPQRSASPSSVRELSPIEESTSPSISGPSWSPSA